MTERQEIEQAITTLETRQGVLDDGVVATSMVLPPCAS